VQVSFDPIASQQPVGGNMQITSLAEDVHETAWGTREFVIKDDQGHTLYFGESR
jgi:hypothetical protein